MRTLLIVFPEPSSRWGGERLRKLCEGLRREGWRPVFLATTERAARQMHGAISQRNWLDGYQVVRAFDASPYVAGSAARRLLRRASRPADSSAAGASAAPAAPGASRSVVLRILDKVWLPDAYAGWAPFAVLAGLRLVRRARPDAIFSSYPPASSHTVALALHRLSGLPWVADFRDPWARAEEQTYPAASPKVAAALEQAVLRHATAVTAVGPALAEILRSRTAAQVHVLPQGFDPSDGGPRPAEPGEVLNVVHMGTLARWPSDPGPLLRAAATLSAEGVRIRVAQVGQLFDVDAPVREGLRAGVLSVADPVGRDEALRTIADADVAVVIRTEPGKLWMTTKVWDYLAARTPILVVGDPSSDVGRLVTSTGAGVAVPYWDEAAIASALRALHERKKRGELSWAPDAARLAEYESPAVSSKLAGILDELAR